jgi:AAA+ ATPase superfamily predicted ATPase
MDDLPWGTDAELTEEQFYNREERISLIKNLLEGTSKGTPPAIMIGGIRGVGKTVLLKKIKKELENEYLICYVDLSATTGYQKGELTEAGVIESFYEGWMEALQTKDFGYSIIQHIIKFFKTNNFGLREIVLAGGGIPIPIPKSEQDYKKLSKYVLNLPKEVIEYSDEVEGSIMIIDEFQALKDLGEEKLNSFLWLIRNIVSNQKKVAYIFSGSLNSRDSIIEKIAGRSGAFGGRMLTVDIHPFTDKIVKDYLDERLPSLILDDSGFERFYKCTNGLPHYVNTFAKLLPQNVPLDGDKVKKEFLRTLDMIDVHLISQWSRLNLEEQNILTVLIDEPLQRKVIAERLDKPSGSLSRSLKKLQKSGLIEPIDTGVYGISEPILKAWLKKEYKEKGVYPYRTI